MKTSETNLPGVGTKTTLTLEGGDSLAVVTHTSGDRELAFFRQGDEQPVHTIRLDVASSCALGVLLCAALDSRRAE